MIVISEPPRVEDREERAPASSGVAFERRRLALSWKRSLVVLALFVLVALAGTGCRQEESGGGSLSQGGSASEAGSASGEGSVVVYSGRNEELVGSIIERFEEESGIDVEVRYGDTAELAATILEEGVNSPADVFLSQDAGALGAVADRGLLSLLSGDVLERVEERFRDPEGRWVGVSGRARVVAYNTEALGAEDLPNSIIEFANPEWGGRLGWPRPTARSRRSSPPSGCSTASSGRRSSSPR